MSNPTGSPHDARMIAVFVPVAAMLAVQALGSMANLTLAVMAPAAAPAFGVDPSWIGFYSGVMYIGAVASTLVSGGFVSRWGPIRVSQVSLLASALGLALLPWGSVWLLAPSALLVGVGYGPMTPASSHILARKAPPQFMSLIFSIKQTGVPAGYALAGSLLPAIVVTWSWQAAAWTAAALCVALAALLQIWREAYDDDRGVRRPFSLEAVVGPLRLVFSHPPLRLLAWASLVFAAMQIGVTAFLVTYLAEGVGLGLVAAGMALTVAQVAAIVGRILWGGLADRLVSPRLMLALLGFGMSLSVWAVTLFTSATPFLIIAGVCAAIGATVIGWNGVFLAETARAAPPGRVGEATGGVLSVTFSGVVLGPPALTLMVSATGGYGAGFVALGIATAIVGALFLVATPTPRSQSETV